MGMGGRFPQLISKEVKMSKRIRLWGVWSVLGFVFLLGIWVFGAPGAKAPNVQLRATFQTQTDAGIPCKILNDSKGSYVTDKSAVSVWITADRGDLDFVIEHHSNRSAFFVFPNDYTTCGYLPDTAGVYPELPDDPVNYLRFHTNNLFSIGGPHLNFLTMTPGVTQQVRLFVFMCSTLTHHYYINYNDSNPTHEAGVVDVMAFDNNGDGKLDRWEISPTPGTTDMAWIWRHPEGSDQQDNCFYMATPMPFKLILERR
jgi:hypothetical protein